MRHGANSVLPEHMLLQRRMVMAREFGFMERLTKAADLQDEPIPGLPLIELAGDRRVLIENHCGVTQYSKEQIQVKVKFGQVRICGQGLELARMSKGQLIISGRVQEIALLRGCR